MTEMTTEKATRAEVYAVVDELIEYQATWRNIGTGWARARFQFLRELIAKHAGMLRHERNNTGVNR